MLPDPYNAFITQVERPAAPRPGPLQGVRVAVKDLIATAGLRTTAGSRILADWVPRRDAPVVRSLVEAGAVVVGKTNTHEFAYGTTNDNPHYGASRNPWNRALTTGGSSGGSAAAVAAGMVPLALGTDTAGSVRIPAALCGCVGFKPGWGALPARGVVPLAPSLDTVGLLAESVVVAARGWAVMTGSEPGERPESLAGKSVGVIEDHAFERVEPGVVRAVEEALRLLESLGARIRRVRLPQLADGALIGLTMVRAEAIAFHSRWFPARREEYGKDVAASLEAGERVSAREYLGARQSRRRLSRTLRGLLGEVDLLAGPTVPMVAFENRVAYEPVAPGGDLPRYALTRLTFPFSLGRLPAISVPCALVGGLPAGLQLAALRETDLLGAAELFEWARGPFPRPDSLQTS